MPSQTEIERARYEAWFKAQRDERSRLRAAREEGFEEGLRIVREQSAQIGKIQFCQELLGESVSSLEELAAEPLVVLNQRLEVLLARLSPRP